MTKGASTQDRPIDERFLALREKVQRCDRQSRANPAPHDLPTTLEILDNRSSEQAWQHYLAHFLDPERQHGLGTSFLRTFIEILQVDGISNPDLQPTYTDTIVKRERPGADSRPDILVYEPERWFICMELKVHHTERSGQTNDHVASPSLGSLDKSTIPADHHYYLYVAPRWAGSGEADEFASCPWYTFTDEPSIVQAITDVTRTTNDIPERTHHHLQEFRETIVNELSKTMVDSHTEELTELYFEHRDEIQRVENAFEEYAEWFFETRVPSALNGEYRPSYWDRNWQYKPYSGYTQLRREEWHRSNGLQAHFEFFPRSKKLSKGEIHLRFDLEYENGWETPDGRGPQQVFADNALEYVDETELPEHATVNEKKSGYIHKLYDIHYSFTVNSDEDYLKALRSALEDAAPLVPAVDQAMEWWDENHTDLEESYRD